MSDSLARLVREVRQHQAGLFLDTNVLLLHAIACTPHFAFAAEWKHTKAFGAAAPTLILAAAKAAHRFVTSPHVLTEATDLAEQGVSGSVRDDVLTALASYACTARERYIPSRIVARDPRFVRFGLADLAQSFLPGGRSAPLVLTADAKLASELTAQGRPVANFNHYALGQFA